MPFIYDAIPEHGNIPPHSEWLTPKNIASEKKKLVSTYRQVFRQLESVEQREGTILTRSILCKGHYFPGSHLLLALRNANFLLTSLGRTWFAPPSSKARAEWLPSRMASFSLFLLWIILPRIQKLKIQFQSLIKNVGIIFLSLNKKTTIDTVKNLEKLSFFQCDPRQCLRRKFPNPIQIH